MTRLRLLCHAMAVIASQACHYCGGAGWIGSNNTKCGVCNGTGTCPGGR